MRAKNLIFMAIVFLTDLESERADLQMLANLACHTAQRYASFYGETRLVANAGAASLIPRQ